eukprot:TRINITY_DN38125_c0_g1_i1.p1 TRINITY_DN38125_c0_g1~~TRINITY_DN38125_c0_g1_i1.p1  ORF type:complete len:1611 (+),score=228.46 TRINITY_DN38125_c0_g1_i1:44-4876(+)
MKMSRGTAVLLFMSYVCMAGAQIEMPPWKGAYHKGNWYYHPPVQYQYRFGQFVYYSPMTKTCLRNLTIHTHPTLCTPPYTSQNYNANLTCVPHELGTMAAMADGFNSNSMFLPDTCILISSSQYQYFGAASFGGRSSELQEVFGRPPIKHAVLGYQNFNNYGQQTTAALLPYMEIGAAATVVTDFTGYKQSSYRVRSDASWFLPGAVKNVLPKRFAVVLEESMAAEFGKAIEAEAAKQGSEIRLRAVIPMVSGSDTSRTDGLMKELIANMIKSQLRYVLVMSGSLTLSSSILCAAWSAVPKVHKFIQIAFFGNANDPAAGWSKTGCYKMAYFNQSTEAGKKHLVDVIEEAGIVSFMPQILLYVDDDLRINLVSGGKGQTKAGSYDLMGQPWNMTFSFDVIFKSMGVPAYDKFLQQQGITGCRDDDAGINASQAIRTLLKKADNETITCSDYMVMALGQSVAFFPSITEVAKFCPVSACNYNAFGSACRVSQCCSKLIPQLGAMNMPPPMTSKLCLSSTMELDTIVPPQLQRCEKRSCRPLPWGAASALQSTFGSYLYAMQGFCQPPCVRMPILELFFIGSDNPRTDGFWSLVSGFICLEQGAAQQAFKHLTAAGATPAQIAAGVAKARSDTLSRLSRAGAGGASDPELAQLYQVCMENHVSFDGATGNINFKYRHSPTPGHMIGLLAQPHMKVSAVTVSGLFTPKDVIISNRVFYRDNSSSCSYGTSYIQPSRKCPAGTTIEFKPSSNNRVSTSEVLGFPMTCKAGETPTPIGTGIELGQKDCFKCKPCAPGTYKSIVGDGLCSPCAPGWFSQTGNSSCTECPRNTKSEEPAENQTLQDGRLQKYGPTKCLSCPGGKYSEKGFDKCLECPAGSYRNSTMDACAVCRDGHYQPKRGSSSCLSCSSILEGSWSPPASIENTSCKCGKGTFLKGASCVPCQKGMDCPGGNDYPLQAEGFSFDFNDKSYSIYECKPKVACPAGEAGKCNQGRVGVACSKCPDGEFFDGAACVVCDAGVTGFWSCTLAFIIVAPIILYYFVNSPMTGKATTLASTTAAAGITVVALQMLAQVSLISIGWPEPLKSIMPLQEIFLLNLEPLGIGCVSADWQSGYVMNCILIPSMVGMILLIYLTLRVLDPYLPQRRFIPKAWDFFKSTNVAGVMCQVSFTALGNKALIPMMCYKHPNGKTSVVQIPSVLCGSADHTFMLPWSIMLLGFLVMFYALCVYLVWIAPMLSADRKNRELGGFKFLIGRFRIDVWWYGPLLYLRGPMMSLCSVIFPDSEAAKLTLMNFCLTLYTGTGLLWRPWKMPLLNFAMGVMDFLLVLITSCGLNFVPQADGSVKDSLGMYATLLLTMVYLVLFTMACITISALVYRGPLDSCDDNSIYTLGRAPSNKLLAGMLKDLCEIGSAVSQEAHASAIGQLAIYDKRQLFDTMYLMGVTPRREERQSERKSRIGRASEVFEAPGRLKYSVEIMKREILYNPTNLGVAAEDLKELEAMFADFEEEDEVEEEVEVAEEEEEEVNKMSTMKSMRSAKRSRRSLNAEVSTEKVAEILRRRQPVGRVSVSDPPLNVSQEPPPKVLEEDGDQQDKVTDAAAQDPLQQEGDTSEAQVMMV